MAEATGSVPAMAPPVPRVALADALLARRGAPESGVPGLRQTLDQVREGVQKVTDAAALRELLHGIAATQSPPAPDKDDVSTLQKVVEMGKALTGTPTERENRLSQELEAERQQRRALEDALFEMREEIHKLRVSSRAEDRDAAATMADAFSKMMGQFMEFSRQVQQPAQNDPLREIGGAVLQSFVNRSPADDLKHVKDILSSLRELGVMPQHGIGTQGLDLNNPQVLGLLLGHQQELYKTDKDAEVRVQTATVNADRFGKLAPVIGVLGTAALAKIAGEDAASAAAGELQQLQQNATPSVRAVPRQTGTGKGRPRVYMCESCGMEVATRAPMTKPFACPNCGSEVGVGA